MPHCISRPIWKTPPWPKLKVNFDGAVFRENQRAGVGVIVRDAEGRVSASMAESFHLPFSIAAVEVLAAKKALQLAKDLGFHSIILKGDLKIAIDGLLSNNSILNEYGHLLSEAKEMFRVWIAKPLKCNYFNSPWASITFYAAKIGVVQTSVGADKTNRCRRSRTTSRTDRLTRGRERRRDISWCRRRRRRRRSSAATEKLAFPNALTPLSDDQNHYTETPQGANREIKGLLLVTIDCHSHGQ
ncbi:hypothetical protein CMV_026058 [Castanea mollissima]|uniref:RNase H type-1 domain-containing protein n=1 Tax=Castanea mollissima TaxID=60419 RepID=A0A8J4VAT2_9ROSI|nr:hypothetical protein CMV_026058 [Castanea mollissima]